MDDTPTVIRCKACDADLTGRYCSNCGQSRDNLKRSIIDLLRDYARDVFAADSRVIKTVATMIKKPGAVPAAYASADRVSYTPPVRMFVIVSFLFFLTLSFADTLFLAIEVRHTPRTADQIAEAGLDLSDPETAERVACSFSATGHFFVRQRDIEIDQDLWRRCAPYVQEEAEMALASQDESGILAGSVRRLFAGMTGAIEDPAPLNNSANVWLGRFTIVMVPILALMIGMFIRGSETFLFDHVIFSLYTHAASFIILGVGVWGVHFGMPQLLQLALIGVFLYFLLSLRAAYALGVIKTVFFALIIAFLYSIVLTIGGLLIPVSILLSA